MFLQSFAFRRLPNSKFLPAQTAGHVPGAPPHPPQDKGKPVTLGPPPAAEKSRPVRPKACAIRCRPRSDHRVRPDHRSMPCRPVSQTPQEIGHVHSLPDQSGLIIGARPRWRQTALLLSSCRGRRAFFSRKNSRIGIRMESSSAPLALLDYDGTVCSVAASWRCGSGELQCRIAIVRAVRAPLPEIIYTGSNCKINDVFCGRAAGRH